MNFQLRRLLPVLVRDHRLIAKMPAAAAVLPSGFDIGIPISGAGGTAGSSTGVVPKSSVSGLEALEMLGLGVTRLPFAFDPDALFQEQFFGLADTHRHPQAFRLTICGFRRFNHRRGRFALFGSTLRMLDK